MSEPKPATCRGFGIVNPFGDIWSTNIFETENEARSYINDYCWSMKGWDATKFSIIPVEATVRAIAGRQALKEEA